MVIMYGYPKIPVTFSQNLTGIIVHRVASTMNTNVPGWSHALSDPMKSRGLPGIDVDRKDSYVSVFFGAPREYGPNEGWQTVRRKKGRGPAFRSRSQQQTNPDHNSAASHPHSDS